MMYLDELDKKILRRIGKNPGMGMVEVGRPYLDRASENTIRYRIRSMASRGLIRIEVTRREKKCYPIELEA